MKAKSAGWARSWRIAAMVGVAIGVYLAIPKPPSDRLRGSSMAPPWSTRAPAPSSAAPGADAGVSPSLDVLDAYAAMRDDTNPKPRLQLIDHWARQAPLDRSRDLMARAMVDPDESVRERAQVLFDRSMTSR